VQCHLTRRRGKRTANPAHRPSVMLVAWVVESVVENASSRGLLVFLSPDIGIEGARFTRATSRSAGSLRGAAAASGIGPMRPADD
jgi:hypothetical protein